MSIQMPFQMVQKYKIRQLGLYFANSENIQNIENMEQNNQYTWLDKHNLKKIYNTNIHPSSYQITSQIDLDTNAKKLLEKADKIKRLKIANPVVICHWDDDTFAHCDEIYAKMQYVKQKMVVLKLREPVKKSTWDTIESDPFSIYAVEKESEKNVGSQETTKKKAAHFLHQFSFNMPAERAEMNGLDRIQYTSLMRKDVNSDKMLQLSSEKYIPETANINNETVSGTLLMYSNNTKPTKSSSRRRMVFHAPLST